MQTAGRWQQLHATWHMQLMTTRGRMPSKAAGPKLARRMTPITDTKPMSSAGKASEPTQSNTAIRFALFALNH